jgi:DNA polymerase delta subunit 1
MSWVTLKPGNYRIRSPEYMISTCSIEVDVWDYTHLDAVPLSVDQSIAPLRILSFNIEVTTDGVRVPQASRDPIICIGNIVNVQGSDQPFVKNVFSLGSCASIVDTQVYSFSDEKKLLEAWRQFIIEVDPDIIAGWDIQNNDMPYIIDRASALGMEKWAKMSRIKSSLTRSKEFHLLTR